LEQQIEAVDKLIAKGGATFAGGDGAGGDGGAGGGSATADGGDKKRPAEWQAKGEPPRKKVRTGVLQFAATSVGKQDRRARTYLRTYVHTYMRKSRWPGCNPNGPASC